MIANDTSGMVLVLIKQLSATNMVNVPNTSRLITNDFKAILAYANDALANGDYVTAMEQTIGSCASVNINETITSGPWMENLLSEKYGRFFETKDHRRMNITEVLKYLKEEQ